MRFFCRRHKYRTIIACQADLAAYISFKRQFPGRWYTKRSVMDQRKKFKKPKKPGGSIDGIVGKNRQLGGTVHRSYQPTRGAQTPELGTFIRRSDGFHQTRSSSVGLGISPEDAETEALLDEPIALDDISAKAKKQHYLK